MVFAGGPYAVQASLGFPIVDAESTTFAYDRVTDTWSWTIDNVDEQVRNAIAHTLARWPVGSLGESAEPGAAPDPAGH